MNITTLSEIKAKVEETYGVLQNFKFYDITDLKLQIDTPEGFSNMKNFVVKPGRKAKITYENGLSTDCSEIHLIKTARGAIRANELVIGDDVIGKTFLTTVTSIDLSEEKEDFYDIEVENDSHLYFTADGICHHNTGKTHTVETTLNKMGLRDGVGYFKNAGSVSAAGLYSLLFKYKNDIILFDDSDDVFGDQEARNVLKTATDTKRIRKIVWNKMGKNIVDPDEMTDEEILDAGLLPRYFEFTGRIIFISNLKINKIDPDGALRTRGYLIDINPTDIEIFDFMDKIAPDIELEPGLKLTLVDRKHVVDLLRKTISKERPSLRKLSRGLNLFAGAIAAGVEVNDIEMQRLIKTYA